MSHITEVKKPQLQTSPAKEITDQAMQVHHLLSSVLSDAYVLLARAQNIHWNFRGPTFYSVHKMTESFYKNQIDVIDDIAERIRALGYPVDVNLKDFKDNSCLKGENPEPRSHCMLEQFVADLSTCTKQLYHTISIVDEADDHVSSDLLTHVVSVYEQAAWQIRSMN